MPVWMKDAMDELWSAFSGTAKIFQIDYECLIHPGQTLFYDIPSDAYMHHKYL